MLLVALALASPISQAQRGVQFSQNCIAQPMPPALDSAGKTPLASDIIEFAATPTLHHPGRAWVVRLSRRGSNEARVEILKLRRQDNCNRYDIEAQWQAPLQDTEYIAMALKVTPVGVPSPSTFVPSSAEDQLESVMDGTGLDLRLRSGDWQVTRSLNYYNRDGSAISAIFWKFASKYVPTSDLPAADWRTTVAPR